MPRVGGEDLLVDFPIPRLPVAQQPAQAAAGLDELELYRRRNVQKQIALEAWTVKLRRATATHLPLSRYQAETPSTKTEAQT